MEVILEGKVMEVNLIEANDIMFKWAGRPGFTNDVICEWCLNHTDGVYDGDKEFTDEDTFICAVETDERDERPHYYHKECWPKYLADLADDPDDSPSMDECWAGAVFDKKVCLMCEDHFDEDLSFTDGAAYYCRECALEMNRKTKEEREISTE